MSSPQADDDLELAIALSLQQTTSAKPYGSSTNDNEGNAAADDSDNDADLRAAIALSLQETNLEKEEESMNVLPATAAHETHQVTSLDPSAVQCNPVSTFMDLDRKTMEEARLARLSKRKRDTSPDRPLKQTTSRVSLDPAKGAETQFNELQYPKGTIKRTIATKYPRSNDINIDEVLQAPTVHIAVLSSFMWDAEWLHEKLDPRKVKQIWVMNAKGRDVQERWEQEMRESRVPNLKIHFPPMDGMIHNMHSKFMLLFGKDKLRLVLLTANMTRIDWGEVANNWQPGVMENSVFLIDLPRRTDGEIGPVETKFGRDFLYYLQRQKLPNNVIEGILKFDFTQTAHLGFVHSIGGVHEPTSEDYTGLARLAECIKELHLDNVENIKLDYATSSLGAVNDSMLLRIHLAAKGIHFSTDQQTRNSQARDSIRKDICIYFPSQGTVTKSVGGADCAGIISLTRQNYNAATFPRECLRNYDSTRRGMLSHNKLLFARGRTKEDKPFAWVYLGSANLSESAWGSQKILKKGDMGSLNIRNWECGVVVPVPAEELAHVKGIPSMNVFAKTIEVPFQYPGEEYTGSQQPWFFKP